LKEELTFMSKSGTRKRRNSTRPATERVSGAAPEQLPTISEKDREEVRQELYEFVTKKLGVPEPRASYLADTYSLVSTHD